MNKKVLLRERKRHTARKRAQDADPPPAGPDPPPPPAGLTFDPDPPGWIDLWPWHPLLDLTLPLPTPPHPPTPLLDWPLTLTPPPAGWTWPPPQVWTKWKHYLPHPSDAGGNNWWLHYNRFRRKILDCIWELLCFSFFFSVFIFMFIWVFHDRHFCQIIWQI